MANRLTKYTTPIKTELIRCGWDEAIDLLDILVKHEPERMENWFEEGGTIKLRRIAERFRNWSLYRFVRPKNEQFPFDNDVDALDTVKMHLVEKKIHGFKY